MDVAKYIKIVFGEVMMLRQTMITNIKTCLLFQWSAGTSAGGCRNDLKLFSTNPQFLLTIHPVRRGFRNNLHFGLLIFYLHCNDG